MGKSIALKIFNIAVIFITCVMTFMTCLLVYYKTFGKSKLPTGVTSTIVSTITDPQTGEKRPAIEANYYSNYNNTGYEVVELLFNAYSGVSKQAIYSRGFQLVKDKEGKVKPYHFEVSDRADIDSNVWQYNRNSFGGSFVSAHNYEWGEPMIIDIDGKTYGIALDGTYTVTTKGFNLGKSTGNFFKALFTDWGMFSQEENWYEYTDYEYKYTWEDLLNKFKEILRSYSNGTGDSVIPLVDLGDFIHVYSYENDKVSGEPIGAGGLINSYFTVSAHYDLRGMTWAEQSIFGSVAGDSQFNISGLETGKDYWKAVHQIRVDESMFTKRYVSSENGFYYTISTDKLNEIKNFEETQDVEVIVTFDIAKIDNVKVLGFDYYALYGLKIKKLTIKSNTQQDFKLLVNSLKDTGLTSVETVNVNLINTQSGVEL